MITKLHRKRITCVRTLCLILLLAIALGGCAFTSYSVDGFSTSRTGRYTRDAQRLAQVERVGVAALYGQNYASPNGSALSRVMETVYAQLLDEIAVQDPIEIISPETVAGDPVYQKYALDQLPGSLYSPILGLTKLPEDVLADSIAEICESLGVDALLFIRIDLDWEYPSINLATAKTRQYLSLRAAPDGETAWESKVIAWVETMVPLPIDITRMLDAGFTDEEWDVVAKATAELKQIRALGGAPIYFLRDDIRAAAESQ